MYFDTIHRHQATKRSLCSEYWWDKWKNELFWQEVNKSNTLLQTGNYMIISIWINDFNSCNTVLSINKHFVSKGLPIKSRVMGKTKTLLLMKRSHILALSCLNFAFTVAIPFLYRYHFVQLSTVDSLRRFYVEINVIGIYLFLRHFCHVSWLNAYSIFFSRISFQIIHKYKHLTWNAMRFVKSMFN